jgi:hypothetical protein
LNDRGSNNRTLLSNTLSAAFFRIFSVFDDVDTAVTFIHCNLNRVLMIDLISIIAVLTVSAVASSACQVSLTESASMPTLGNAGFEHFVLDQKHYVATANFWSVIHPSLSTCYL